MRKVKKMANENARNFVKEFAALMGKQSTAASLSTEGKAPAFDVQAALAIVSEVQDANRELGFELREANRVKDAAVADLAAKTTEIGTLNARLVTIETDSLSNVAALRDANEAKTALETEKGTLETAKTAAETELETLRAQVAELTTSVNTLTMEKTDLETRLNAAEAAKLGANVEGVQGEVVAEAKVLSAEEAALVATGGSEEAKLSIREQFEALQKKANEQGGEASRQMDRFAQEHRSELGML
jgi:chromosome segregation ATPase